MPSAPQFVPTYEVGDPVWFAIYTAKGSVGPINGEIVETLPDDEVIIADAYGNRYLAPAGWVHRRKGHGWTIKKALDKPRDTLVDSVDVAKLLGVRHQQLHVWAREGRFPESVHGAQGRNYRQQWRLGDVMDWLDSEIAHRLMTNRRRKGAA